MQAPIRTFAETRETREFCAPALRSSNWAWRNRTPCFFGPDGASRTTSGQEDGKSPGSAVPIFHERSMSSSP